MEETPGFTADDFADIVAKDNRFDARAYVQLMDVVHALTEGGHHASGEEILDEFRETTLDDFGPLSYRVLAEWGVHTTEDIGEMMMNLVEFHRLGRDDSDSYDAFSNGYDFKEAFLDPYQT